MKNDKHLPKVLIISHNPFSLRNNNGKTLSTIFKGWPKESLAQIYFRGEQPDFTVCKNFFLITDRDILTRKRKDIGREIDLVSSSDIKGEKQNSLYSRFGNLLSIPASIRNIVWGTKRWNNDKLDKWVKSFAPDLIFLVGGGAAFSYSISLSIANRQLIPIFLYYTDDYLSPLFTINPLWWMNYLLLKLMLRRVLIITRTVFVISEDMANEYLEKLGKPCITIMNAVNTDEYKQPSENTNKSEVRKNELRIAYFGGLHLNRWKSLILVGKAIEELVKESHYEVSLSVYSNKPPRRSVMNLLSNAPYVIFCGSVNENEIITEMQKFDVLLHVESFEKAMIHRTRLSISTKIPEYLATGKFILAVGPKQASSIRYLKKLSTSYIVEDYSKQSVKYSLTRIIKEKWRASEVCTINTSIAEVNHSISNNQRILRENLKVSVFKSRS